MAQDWTEDREKLNLAFRLMDALTFSAGGSTEDIVLEFRPNSDAPDWTAPGLRWSDTGYIAGLDDAE